MKISAFHSHLGNKAIMGMKFWDSSDSQRLSRDLRKEEALTDE